jgi:hypothetical protein
MCYRLMLLGRLTINTIHQILKSIMFSVRADIYVYIYMRIELDFVYKTLKWFFLAEVIKVVQKNTKYRITVILRLR